MGQEASFAAILDEKIAMKLSEIDTQMDPNYEPFRFEIRVSPSFEPHVSQNPKRNVAKAYWNQHIQNPTEAQPESPKTHEPKPEFSSEGIAESTLPPQKLLSVEELSSIGVVAFRMLSGLTEAPLNNLLSEPYLKQLKRRLSKKLHPDLGGTADGFMRMLEAISILESELEQASEQEPA